MVYDPSIRNYDVFLLFYAFKTSRVNIVFVLVLNLCEYIRTGEEESRITAFVRQCESGAEEDAG
jgi:hypothetical protein